VIGEPLRAATLPRGGLDARAGLAALVEAGVLVAEADGDHVFARPGLAAALAERAPAEARRRWHAAALESATRDEDVARHAAGAGEPGRARAALARRAARALAGFDELRADELYTRALELPGPPDAALLAGRARARLRMFHPRAALDDVRAARRIRDDAELALDEATVLDWLEDYAGSAACVAAASGADPTRRALGEGRTAYRRQDLARAERELRAALAGDHETAVVARLLLGPTLALLGKADEAEDVLDEAIRRCQAIGDLAHLASAYSNRTLLVHRPPAALEADMRQAVLLSRRIGHAQLEGAATHNLAEYLHWRGHSEEALQLARRAGSILSRFHGGALVDVHRLLHARIAVAAGERDEARAALAAARGGDPIMRRLAELLVHGGTREEWAALRERGEREALGGERDELRRVCEQFAGPSTA
jgi:tetratricopeptide (TPR) repeat protein